MEALIVNIEQGKLKGNITRDIDGNSFYSFTGIPYAKPPLGPLRFKSPLPPTPWEGIFDATKPGNCCFSSDVFSKKFIGSEDCLNLNVYAPTLPVSDLSLLPVMVWIHGGGFLSGSNSPDFYGPEFLLTAKIVLVTINYRIGLLGFLSLDDPELGIPGNAGFKDMVMALKWVQKNIKYFSGNPNNVTIFGESAGGTAVHHLMLSPMAQGLFHKAIAQSGCALNPWSRGKKCDEEMRKILEIGGKNNQEVLEYLQNLPVEELLQKQAKIPYTIDVSRLTPYGLVIERSLDEQGEVPFMYEDPIDIINSKKISIIPFMIGFTSMEGLVVNTYRPRRSLPMITNFENNVPHLLGYPKGSHKAIMVGQQIKEFYYGNEEPNENNRHKLYDMVTDNNFLYGIYASVKKHVSNSNAPVYFYRMSLKTSLQFLQPLMKIDKHLGAAHGDDVAYLFKNVFTPELTLDSEEYIYIKRFVHLWTNFAYYGNPTPGDSEIIWEKVTRSQFCCFDLGREFTLDRNFQSDSLIFWDKLYSESPSGNKIPTLRCKI